MKQDAFKVEVAWEAAVSEDHRRRDPKENWVERGTDVERTVFFSDAVFAIAITLLALVIRVPEVPEEATALREALFELWPKLFSFFISFWFVGIYWVAHHRVFHYVRVTTAGCCSQPPVSHVGRAVPVLILAARRVRRSRGSR